MKLGILFFVTLFFQTAFVPASEAGEMAPFYKSWLQEHSYAHPGIGSSPAVAPAAKSLAKAAPASAVKSSVAKTKSAPKFNICNFVCLSTCKTCKTSSNNYLMSRE